MAKAVGEIRTDFILLEDRQLAFDTGSCALLAGRHVQVAGVAGRYCSAIQELLCFTFSHFTKFLKSQLHKLVFLIVFVESHSSNLCFFGFNPVTNCYFQTCHTSLHTIDLRVPRKCKREGLESTGPFHVRQRFHCFLPMRKYIYKLHINFIRLYRIFLRKD